MSLIRRVHYVNTASNPVLLQCRDSVSLDEDHKETLKRVRTNSLQSHLHHHSSSKPLARCKEHFL